MEIGCAKPLVLGYRLNIKPLFIDGQWQKPVGGFKASGVGRGMGVEGFEAYCEVKTIYAVGPEAL